MHLELKGLWISKFTALLNKGMYSTSKAAEANNLASLNTMYVECSGMDTRKLTYWLSRKGKDNIDWNDRMVHNHMEPEKKQGPDMIASPIYTTCSRALRCIK